MEQKSNHFLETEAIQTLMRKYALPCIISLLVAALYNIVDQIFIANASYLGSYGNAANTVVFPLTVVALAVAVMIGDGCCAFVSLSLGANDKTKAHQSIGNAILLCLTASLLLTAVYLLFQDAILTMFGGQVNAETFALSKSYFFTITLGIPFYMFGQAMNPIIRSDGSPKFAMISTLAGAAVNIILDPIFIFIFKWGMMGAAAATVIGQVLTAVLAIWYLCHMKAVTLNKNSFTIQPKLTLRFLSLGICSFLSQISLVAAMAAINNMITKYGALDPIFSQAQYAQIPMAVVGIVMKFFQIVISIAECFPHQLITVFGAANESIYYTEFAVRSFRIYLCMMIFACVNKATFIYLQALGKALVSTLLSMLREVVFGVGFALILPLFFGLDGVLYSMPVSDILTFLISAAVIFSTYKYLDSEQKKEILS